MYMNTRKGTLLVTLIPKEKNGIIIEEKIKEGKVVVSGEDCEVQVGEVVWFKDGIRVVLDDVEYYQIGEQTVLYRL